MTRLVAAAALWLAAVAPAAAEIDIQELTTPGGTQAWLIEEPSIPFVAIEFLFRGGGIADTPATSGATHLMTALLEEGAGDMDARRFAEARDDLAASLRFDSSDDYVSVSVRFLSDTTDATTDLLRAVLTEPRFDPDAVERVRAQVLSGLRRDAEDPDTVAGSTFSAMAFGDHPYGAPFEGSLESVAALTRDDLVAAHRATMARDRVYVAAAGDIGPDRLAALIDTVLAGLPDTGTDLPARAPLLLEGGITVIPFATPQSVVQFGHAGISRDDPDFFPAFVLNQILGGGGFGSRLMQEVREKRGLTYGIGTYLAQKDLADLYVGRVATQNATVGETIQVITDEWRRMAEDGPTEDELSRAKTYLTGAYPLRFDGNASLANILVGMQADGLPVDYIATRNDKVEAVTMEDVRRVAARLLQPDALSFVVVGQPEGLPPGN
jgi:zinc protease